MGARDQRHNIAALRRAVNTRRVIRDITPTKRWFQGDSALWIIIAVLSVVSVLVVYSSTAKMAYDNAAITSTSQFLQAQIKALLLGGALILGVAHLLRTRFFFGFAPWAFILSLICTLAVYFFGTSTNGAARWISIAGFQFQPSEALKVATVMYLARVLATKQRFITKIELVPTLRFWRWRSDPHQRKILREGFWPLLFPMLLACAIVVPAHTSSALLLFGSSMVMFMMGRVPFRELWRITRLVVCVGAIFYLVGAGRSDTAGGRVSTWIDLWTSDRTDIPVDELSDTERSMIAIYNGGIKGVGAGKSAMRVEMIHPESDYAYAFFIEEYGSLLAIAMMMLYIWIFFRAITIFEECGTTFPGLLVLGLAMMITCQALLHIAVTINLIPETGQTLPLISRGGSSLIFNAIALGMIISISRETEDEPC